MIKTTYQTPELRDANDNVVQEGAFGKNSPLTNATNDGAFDYILNNLEALHDTIGDSAPTLDGNGHVVEPANLAIGDEDGLRIKNNYLKLSGGNVTGVTSFRTDLRMLDNQDNRFGGLYVPGTTSTEQYLQLYGGTRTTGDARLTLYPSGDGHFQLLAYSNDGSISYALQSDNAGNLNWRGYPLAWKKDYLPLAGGVMTGNIRNNSSGFVIGNVTSNNDGLIEIRSAYVSYRNGALLSLKAINNSNGAGEFSLQAADGTTNVALTGKPNGILTWGGKPVFRGTSNINSGNGLGYEKNEANNTVKQWYRIGVNAGESQTWTFGTPMLNTYYYCSAVGENGNNVSITSKSETSLTIKNNGSTWCGVSILVIGTPATQ